MSSRSVSIVTELRQSWMHDKTNRQCFFASFDWLVAIVRENGWVWTLLGPWEQRTVQRTPVYLTLLRKTFTMPDQVAQSTNPPAAAESPGQSKPTDQYVHAFISYMDWGLDADY